MNNLINNLLKMDSSTALHTLHMHNIEVYPLPSAFKEGILYYSGKLTEEEISLIKIYCGREDIQLKEATEKEIKAYEDFVKNEVIIKE